MDMPPLSNKPNYNSLLTLSDEALASKEYESALFYAEEALDVAQTETERAKAMNFKGECLIALQRYEEALSLYNHLLDQFRNDCKREADPYLKGHIAKAFFQKIETLSKLERQAEISSVYDEMVCRFGEDNTPFIRKYLAKEALPAIHRPLGPRLGKGSPRGGEGERGGDTVAGAAAAAAAACTAASAWCIPLPLSPPPPSRGRPTQHPHPDAHTHSHPPRQAHSPTRGAPPRELRPRLKRRTRAALRASRRQGTRACRLAR